MENEELLKNLSDTKMGKAIIMMLMRAEEISVNDKTDINIVSSEAGIVMIPSENFEKLFKEGYESLKSNLEKEDSISDEQKEELLSSYRDNILLQEIKYKEVLERRESIDQEMINELQVGE